MAAKKRILLVEDEVAVRESLRDWLTEDGYEVDVAENGQEALEKIKGKEFGMLVLDLKLPGMDGLQVFEHAKELKPKTKGVIITAYPSKDTQEKAKRLGLFEYLVKPFKVEDLEKIVDGALGDIEWEEVEKKPLWLGLGAVSFRLCDRNYECGSCGFAQDIQDRFGTIAVIGEDEVARLRRLPGAQRLCRYASVHFLKKEPTSE
ncbi:MAG: response regulator [Chloroflexota bacterium]